MRTGINIYDCSICLTCIYMFFSFSTNAVFMIEQRIVWLSAPTSCRSPWSMQTKHGLSKTPFESIILDRTHKRTSAVAITCNLVCLILKLFIDAYILVLIDLKIFLIVYNLTVVFLWPVAMHGYQPSLLAVFSSRKNLYYGTIVYFVVIWQLISNYGLIRLKRFILYKTIILCN